MRAPDPLPVHLSGHGSDAEADLRWRRLRHVAPLAPLWFTAGLARLLGRAAGADQLLLIADAIEECARAAALENQPILAAQLRELADTPRARARRATSPGDTSCP